MIPVNKTIGIIGGGQLGRMLTPPAKQLGFNVIVLDKTPNSPAGQLADEQIIGELTDPEKLKELVEKSDIVTYEIEHIAVEPLRDLSEKGAQIFPDPEVLGIIQNKYAQKAELERHGVPTSKFEKIDSLDEIENLIEEKFTYPVVQKVCMGGYDGRGVFVIKNKEDLKNILRADSFLEEYVEFELELAVNVARNANGEIKCHPVSEMAFNEAANICDMVIAPARVSEKIKKKAIEVSIKAIEALGEGAVGIFGVELFLTRKGEVLVNEIAPRPHNSGHYTIEACVTSQYEQHIRAIANFPLGSTEQLKPAVMINILGDDEECKTFFSNFKKILAIPEAAIHWYGKAGITPMRKVGHITLTANTMEEALKKADQVRSLMYKN